MRPEDLIDELVTELKPVRPVSRIGVLTLGAGIYTLLLLAAGVILLGVRGDLSRQTLSRLYWTSFLTPLIAAGIFIFLLDWISVPGRSTARVSPLWFTALPLPLIAAMGSEVAHYDSAQVSLGTASIGAVCFFYVLLLAAPATLLLFWFANARALVHPRLGATLVILSGVSAGMAGIAVHCTSENAVHILLWHWLLPTLTGVLLIAPFLRKSLRW